MDDLRLRGAAGMALGELMRELAADGELDDADLARIADAAARERGRITSERTAAERAHVHDEPHVSVVTTGADGVEEVDASGVVCHDCQRALVSDAGSLRILVCPTLHNRRPSQLVPVADGAVECGGS